MNAFFLDAKQGQRFCLFHAPPSGQKIVGGLVYVQPFAEEANCTRRLAALQARAFASAGYAVLQIDLLGTGDSSGDFSEASWGAWIEDIALALLWLHSRVEGNIWLWGVRAGCLLAADVINLHPRLCANLLFWQPVLTGRQHLSQFLRLKAASNMLQGKRGGTQELRVQLEAGQAVEVAGYTLSPQLAAGLESSSLENIQHVQRVVCIETATSVETGVSPALSAQLLRWQAVGLEAVGHVVDGPQFWQMQQTSPCLALCDASLAAISANRT